MDYDDQVRAVADAVRGRVGEIPSIGIVLGSGLGGFVESLDDQRARVEPDRLQHRERHPDPSLRLLPLPFDARLL